MASSRARGALVAACPRVAAVFLLAGLALQPVPALAAHGAHGNSGFAAGHNKVAVATAAAGHGGLTTRGVPPPAAAALVAAGPRRAAVAAPSFTPTVSTPAPPPVSTPAPPPVATATPPPQALRAAAGRAAPPARGAAAVAGPVAIAEPAPGLVAAGRRNPGLETFPPPIVLPPGAEGQRVAVALFTLPLLVAVWLWALSRLAVSAWVHRASGIRAALALQLGIPAEQLAGLDMTGLRRLRDGIAFDELTGVLRRAAGLASMDRELARSARADHPVSVAFIDVDGLKATNDALGHESGDALLRRVAVLLRGRLRAQDLIFRYGGDEFVAVLPGTPRQRAERLIEDLRRTAEGGGVHFSYGVVQAAREDTSADVIARADSLQYLDKEQRRAGR